MRISPWLVAALVVGLVLRVMLWDRLPRPGFISDEAEYLAAANWLAEGRGFAWHQGWLWTRAPLYPLFLAAHIALFGIHLAPIYITQAGLSLLNVALVYLLARQAAGSEEGKSAHPVPFVAALLAAVSFPFATHTQMLLSETLYLSLVLALFAALGRWVGQRAERGSQWTLLALAGVLAGLAVLTRGLTLGFLPLLLVWMWWQQRGQGTWQTWGPLVVFALACSCTVLPWSLYASRAYGGVVLVDTSGAYNLLLGARTAHDSNRGDAATRDFLLALLDERRSTSERQELLRDSCLLQQQDSALLAALNQPVASITQAQRQRLMLAEGWCLVAAAPGEFARKGLEETARFFQINYAGDERLTDDFTHGRLPRWYTLALFLLDDTLYVALVPLAVVGWALLRGPWRGLIGLWWLYLLLTAPLLFAINRFRLPMLPFAFICAAVALARWRRWEGWKLPRRRWLPRLAALLALLLALVALAPYAYLQAPPSTWASYLGPYPSSLDATIKAWESRPAGLRNQEVIAALGAGNAQQARALLAAGDIFPRTERVALPLLEGLEGRPAEGLALLPSPQDIASSGDWRSAVVRGDLLRRMGDMDGARAAFTPTYVDDQNPVAWAWEWLHPPPTRRIDLAGNLDPGYIKGFYLGEGDPAAGGTFRWSGPRALLRFPEQGSSAAQQLCLRADGRGWPADMALPRVEVLAQQGARFQAAGAVDIEREVGEYCVDLPTQPARVDVVVMLRSRVFVPPAADLLGQQGPQVGQLRLLGVRLDWAELRHSGERLPNGEE